MPDEERLLADFFNMSKAHIACLGGDESGEQAHTRLAQDFRREDVPEELQEDKQLFLMLAKLSDQEMPADIAEEITVFVNNLGQTEKESVLPEAKQPKEITYHLKTPPKMFCRVAATVAFLLALGGGIIAYPKLTDPYRDTCAMDGVTPQFEGHKECAIFMGNTPEQVAELCRWLEKHIKR